MLLGNKPIGTVGYLGGLMSLPEKFCWCWGQMVQYNAEFLCNPGQYVHYNRATVSFHSVARNSLVEGMKGDWLFSIDTDHEFEPDIVARLLHRMNAYDIDVIVGIYTYKSPPYLPVLYQSDDNGAFQQLVQWQDADVFEIGSAGGGCLLVKRKVFDRIRDELKESPFDIEFPFSEDHSFFRRLYKLGIKAYCAPTVEAKHMIVTSVGVDDIQRDKITTISQKEVQGFV